MFEDAKTTAAEAEKEAAQAEQMKSADAGSCRPGRDKYEFGAFFARKPSPRPPLRQRVSQDRQQAEVEAIRAAERCERASMRANQLAELDVLLDSYPPVARVLELIDLINVSSF